jgi:hypothetical protein
MRGRNSELRIEQEHSWTANEKPLRNGACVTFALSPSKVASLRKEAVLQLPVVPLDLMKPKERIACQALIDDHLAQENAE